MIATPRNAAARIGLLAIFLAAHASAAPAPSDPPAGPITFEARLGVFYAGFLVYSGRLVGNVADGRYSVTYDARTRGLLRLISKVETRNEAVGLLREGRFRPLTYRDRVLWRTKRTAVQVAFGPDGAERTTSTPPFAERKRWPIPASQSDGAIDPLTTLLSHMASTAEPRPCGWSHRIYDGRRVIRLDFKNMGRDRLLHDNLTLYSGPAVKCRVRLTILADTRHKPGAPKKKKDAEPDEAVFWLARLKRPAIWLPVRARGWSKVGAVEAGLTYLRIDGAK